MFKPKLYSSGTAIFIFLLLLMVLNPLVIYSQYDLNDWYYNPFNKNSAQHRPVGTGAEYADSDHPVTKAWVEFIPANNGLPGGPGWGTINQTFNFGHFLTKSDPENNPAVSIIRKRCDGGSGTPLGPWNGADPLTLYPPVGWPHSENNNLRCSDRACTIYEPETFTGWNFFRYNSTPQTQAEALYNYDFRGLGHGTVLNERMGTSAFGGVALFGALRAEILMTPGEPINHVLQIVLPRRADHPAQLSSRSLQWPAVAIDGSAMSNPNDNTGLIPYGALMAIPPVSKGGPDPDTMGLSEVGRRLYDAMVTRGMIMIDGGSNVVTRCTGPLPYDLFLQARTDYRKLIHHLRLVTNAVIDADAEYIIGEGYTGSLGTPTWPAGGGEPLGPNVGLSDEFTSVGDLPDTMDFLNQIKIFPNPAKESITIQIEQLKDQMNVEVINSLSQIVKSRRLTNHVTNLNLPEANDIYFIRVTSDKRSQTFRVVKL